MLANKQTDTPTYTHITIFRSLPWWGAVTINMYARLTMLVSINC